MIEKYVSRSGGPAKVTRERNDDYRRQAACVQGVSLNYHHRPPQTRIRADRVGKRCPEDLTLAYYHSDLSSA